MEVILKAMVLRRFSVTAMLKWSHWISTLNNRKGADDLPHCELAMVFVHSLSFLIFSCGAYGTTIIYHHVYIRARKVRGAEIPQNFDLNVDRYIDI